MKEEFPINNEGPKEGPEVQEDEEKKTYPSLEDLEEEVREGIASLKTKEEIKAFVDERKRLLSNERARRLNRLSELAEKTSDLLRYGVYKDERKKLLAEIKLLLTRRGYKENELIDSERLDDPNTRLFDLVFFELSKSKDERVVQLANEIKERFSTTGRTFASFRVQERFFQKEEEINNKDTKGRDLLDKLVERRLEEIQGSEGEDLLKGIDEI